jgi:hypothetical protein
MTMDKKKMAMGKNGKDKRICIQCGHTYPEHYQGMQGGVCEHCRKKAKEEENGPSIRQGWSQYENEGARWGQK